MPDVPDPRQPEPRIYVKGRIRIGTCGDGEPGEGDDDD